jgi:nucleotide-binding universal stress UspA family protein
MHVAQLSPATSIKILTVLCALDLKLQSRDTIAWASRLAKDFDARLSVIHVIPPINPELYVTFGSGVKQECEDLARKDVEQVQREVDTPSVSICIQEGDPARQVCSFAEAIGADLLVIGRGTHDGRLRTNAYGIIRQAPCPVLSV